MALEYKCVEMRAKLLSGRVTGDKLEKVLNEHAREGWRLVSVVPAVLTSRVGTATLPDELLVTFERETT